MNLVFYQKPDCTYELMCIFIHDDGIEIKQKIRARVRGRRRERERN